MRTWEGMRIWEARMGLYEDVVFYMGKVGRYPICANGIWNQGNLSTYNILPFLFLFPFLWFSFPCLSPLSFVSRKQE